MRAVLLSSPRARLDVVEVTATRLEPHEVLIETKASGLCHSDLSIIQAPVSRLPLPVVMGHEGSGIVLEVGAEVETLAVGDRVIACWVPACGHCYWCVRGQANVCVNFTTNQARAPWRLADGSAVSTQTGIGTMAEQMIGNELSFIRVDTDLPDEYLALIGCGVTTGACAAMRAAPVTPGSSVAVFGCGGVGLSAVQGARIAGAAILIAIDPVAGKREAALALGATHAIDPGAIDPLEAIKELTAGRGSDFAFETAGRNDTATWAVQAVRRGGTAVMVGAGQPDVSSLNPSTAKTVKWSIYGDADPRRDFPLLVSMVERGLLDLESMVSRRITLDEVNEGFEAMERGEVIRSVIVL
jgi:S-(hydroxymethyl)glutathione dehydrogenase/alcohol dehydrogenase